MTQMNLALTIILLCCPLAIFVALRESTEFQKDILDNNTKRARKATRQVEPRKSNAARRNATLKSKQIELQISDASPSPITTLSTEPPTGFPTKVPTRAPTASPSSSATESLSTSKMETLTYEHFRLQTNFSPPALHSSHGNLDACLIHVGKAAGSTIGCIVGNIQLPTCMPGSEQSAKFEPYRNSSELVQILLRTGAKQNWRHLHSNRCRLNSQFQHLLVTTTRDPISRLMSAFNYEQKNCFHTPRKPSMESCGDIYEDCYEDFESLAAHGLKEFYESIKTQNQSLPARSANMTCPQRAMGFTTGMRQFWTYNHHWHNYEFYFPYLLHGQEKQINRTMWQQRDLQPIDLAMETLPASRVVVLRNEHLAKDWNDIDSLLGGNGTMGNTLFSHKLNPSTKQALSEEALKYLCQALCVEIQYYKLTLWWSSNLHASDIEESMDILRQSCPGEPSGLQRCEAVLDAGRFPGSGFYRPSGYALGEGKPRLKIF